VKNDAHQRLEVLLDREIDAARSLANTLDVERAALTGPSADAVTEIAARKIELFGLIEQINRQRLELCDALSVSLPSMHSGRTPVLAGVPDAIADRWHSLLELMARCRVANEVNGYIINARRGQVRQLLQIVRGGTPGTYGPQGKHESQSLRALARA
jgi:flagellar biosynthesis/type III secretory pathway chaperone